MVIKYFPSELAGGLGQSIKLHFLSLYFHVISGAFGAIYRQQLLG
jgi:hypothetical protein